VQDIVVGNKQFTEATKPSEIVSLLLNDEELANLENAPSTVDASTTKISEKRAGKQPEGVKSAPGVRDFWNEEGDDFFGQSNPAPVPTLGMDIEDDMTSPPPSEIMTTKKGKGTGAKRGRKKKIANGV
jgi:DNA helicase INO80